MEQDFQILLPRSFVALAPVAYVLWQWYLESKFRFKIVIVALLVVGGLPALVYV